MYHICACISYPIYYYWYMTQRNHDTHNICMYERLLWDRNHVASFGSLKYMNAWINQTCQPLSEYTIWCMHHIRACISYPIYYYWCLRQSNHDTHNKHVHEMQLWDMNDVASFEPLKYMNAWIYQTYKSIFEYTI